MATCIDCPQPATPGYRARDKANKKSRRCDECHKRWVRRTTSDELARLPSRGRQPESGPRCGQRKRTGR